MDIRAILANQSGPAVLVDGLDRHGQPTDDLAQVVSGSVLIPQTDGSTPLVPLLRLVELGAPVSIRA